MYVASSASSVTEPSSPIPRSSADAASGLMSMLSDCPPSKPISIRTWSDMGHHLRENAVDGIRMDEGDLKPEESLVRLGVDQFRALALQRLERRMDVSHLDRDVMHSRPARGVRHPCGTRVAEARGRGTGRRRAARGTLRARG